MYTISNTGKSETLKDTHISGKGPVSVRHRKMLSEQGSNSSNQTVTQKVNMIPAEAMSVIPENTLRMQPIEEEEEQLQPKLRMQPIEEEEEP